MNTLVPASDAGALPQLADTTDSLAVRLAQVEIDSAVSTAKKFPRQLVAVKNNILDLVMLDEETAAECVYALPRGGKPIKGPSIRFAEIVASQYGNCHLGSRVVDVNRHEKYVEAEGVFVDLQSGMKRAARIRRRIVDKTGRLFNDDMIIVTGNAACSIALREAVLKGVPKALWRAAYDAAENVIAGDVKTLAVRRGDAIKAFAAWGIVPDQIFACLEVDGLDDIGLDEIATLGAMYKAIKSGEQTVEDYFPAKTDAKAGVEAARGTAGKLAAIAGQAKAPQDAAQGAPQAGPGPAPDSPADAAGPGPGDPQDAADSEEPAVTDEQLAAARQQGDAARRAGRKASACPAELRKSQRLFDAWNDGWAEADESLQNNG